MSTLTLYEKGSRGVKERKGITYLHKVGSVTTTRGILRERITLRGEDLHPYLPIS